MNVCERKRQHRSAGIAANGFVMDLVNVQQSKCQ